MTFHLFEAFYFRWRKLQKFRSRKGGVRTTPFKWQPWCWAYFFLLQSWPTCLDLACWCCSLSHVWLQLSSNFQSRFQLVWEDSQILYNISSLTNSYPKTDSLISVWKQLFSSQFFLDFNPGSVKVTFVRVFFVLPHRYRSKSQVPFKCYLFFSFP